MIWVRKRMFKDYGIGECKTRRRGDWVIWRWGTGNYGIRDCGGNRRMLLIRRIVVTKYGASAVSGRQPRSTTSRLNARGSRGNSTRPKMPNGQIAARAAMDLGRTITSNATAWTSTGAGRAGLAQGSGGGSGRISRSRE
jgi:hypothetical protein